MKKQLSYLLIVLLLVLTVPKNIIAQNDKYKDIIKTDGIKNKKYANVMVLLLVMRQHLLIKKY